MNINIKNIDLTNYIVIGVSAGPDSMCLLDIMKNKTNKIVVCHINHNVRKESIDEEKYLEEYCKENKLIFEKMIINEYTENNFENEARNKRYCFYEKTLKKYNAKYLFLAHHADDLIETILMKIVRGSNLEGYAGIKEISEVKDYFIVRPLISYTKEEILNYNKLNNITYFIDNTNTDTNYTRNRYRKNILPQLKDEDKNIHKKFLKYSKTLTEYDLYIKELVKKNINKIFNDNIIYIDEFNKLDEFLQKNTLYYILNTVYNNKNNIIKENHISDILKIITNKKPNITLDLPHNIILIKEYNKIFIKKKNKIIENNEYRIEIDNKISIENLYFSIVQNECNDGNNICRLNTKEIKLPIYIRNKKNGDYIILKGNNHRKKIKEIFIEEKIPINKRKTYPLLVDSNDNILWIPNIKKSKFCIKRDEKDKNYDIIIKCDEREENYE